MTDRHVVVVVMLWGSSKNLARRRITFESRTEPRDISVTLIPYFLKSDYSAYTVRTEEAWECVSSTYRFLYNHRGTETQSFFVWIEQYISANTRRLLFLTRFFESLILLLCASVSLWLDLIKDGGLPCLDFLLHPINNPSPPCFEEQARIELVLRLLFMSCILMEVSHE